MPVLQIRKETGEVTKLIPEERIPECIVEEITDILVPRRRTRDSHAQGVRWKDAGIHKRRTGPIWVMKVKDNKLEELKVIIVVGSDAEYIKKL